MKRIFTVSTVKNESDIIESFCRYNLVYCDGMLIKDNGSSDNTPEILEKLINEGLPIYLTQGENQTKRAHIAVNEYGADLIIPLDADEFLYHTDGINPREVLEAMSEDVEYQAIWRTYIYKKEPDINLGFMPNNFMYYRNPEMENPDIYTRHKKTIASKYLLNEKNASFIGGSHFLVYPDEYRDSVKTQIHENLVFAHFPIRSKNQVMSKGIPNWIIKWAIPFPRPSREMLDAFQLGILFNEIKKNGDISTEKIKQFSLEYAMSLDFDISWNMIIKKREDLENLKKGFGDKLEIPGSLNIHFCIDNINLRYTTYNNDNKILLRSILNEVDKVITYLDNDSIEKTRQLQEFNTSFSCSIYFDCGFGYSNNNKSSYLITGKSVEISCQIPHNAVSVKLNPADGFGCILSNLEIISKDAVMQYDTNGFMSKNGSIVFINDDNHVIINECTNWLKIKYNILVLSEHWQFNFLFDYITSYKNNENLMNVNKNITEYNNEVIKERNNYITKCDNLTVEKENLTVLNNEYSFQLESYISMYNKLLIDRNNILNSNSWKITKPLRFIKRALKKIIKIICNTALIKFLLKNTNPFFKYFLPMSLYKKIFYKLIKIAKLDNNYDNLSLNNEKVSVEFWDNEVPIPYENPPLVSIIVPNYNHVQYLKKRLDTIYSQTYKNYEVILLDDCSSDDSRLILNRYAKKYKNKTITVFNNENSGNVFEQWKKGIALAKGTLIWIAESDDYSSSNFLNTLVPVFKSQSTMLAFSQSKFVRNNDVFFDTQNYLSDITGIDWNSTFTITAHEIVNKAFAIKNIILNVSSAVFRNIKTIPDELLSILDNIKLCGDWLFYLSLIRGGAVHYTDKTTNYYRVHDKSTSLSIQKTDQYYKEFEIVSKYIIEHYNIPIDIFNIVSKNLHEHYKAIQSVSDSSNVDIYYDISRIKENETKRKPNILMCILSMQMGGGETYPLYLSNELKRLGMCVTVIDFRISDFDRNVREFLDPSIPLIEIKSLSNLLKTINQFDGDIIHSHHASVDYTISNTIKFGTTKCSHIVTLHGMYECISPDHAFNVLNDISKKCSCFVYTSDKNITILKQLPSYNKLNVKYIGNALPKLGINPVDRALLKIKHDDFVFCLVSRGIPEKGWQEAADALILANKTQGRKIHLVIIGDGEMFELIRKKRIPNLHLLGNKTNIRDYFAMSDMGILPSRFKGESFPLVVIDCLLSGKPVLASNIGEISKQLEDDSGQIAGKLFPLHNWNIDIQELASIMRNLVDNSIEYNILLNRVSSAAGKFDMEKIAKEYQNIYINKGFFND